MAETDLMTLIQEMTVFRGVHRHAFHNFYGQDGC